MDQHGRLSLWRDTAGVDAAAARALADRLELRATAEDEIEARDTYLGLLGIADGERVLDAGCGSGVVTREIARRVGPGGRVVGLDLSPALLAVARELADRAGLGERIEFRAGSVLELPFPDGAFDAVLGVTVLSHVPGGFAGVAELARVVRPGGRLGIFDIDTDMTLFTHADRALTRRIVAAASDAQAVDGWLGRRLPSLFAEAGLTDVRVRGFFPAETDPGGFYGNLADRCADAALKTGAIDAAEHRAWLEPLRADRDRGVLVAGRLHLFVRGVVPSIPLQESLR
jgi:ubiquinone/menaquinone biosynthesis C-methylase UbiE